MTVELIPLRGLPEVPTGADLAGLIAGALERSGLRPQDGDVVVVTQKVVSKAEGCLVVLKDVTPSPFAEAYARQWEKDAA